MVKTPISAMLISTLILISPFPVQNRQVVGRAELVKIYPGNLELRARMDTGAKCSSIDADHVKKFERGGANWVQFTVINHRGEKITIEKKVIRWSKIKRKRAKTIIRPVVMLGICLGDLYRVVEVNLADRDNFNYPMLIGRSFMENTIVVDPSTSYVTRPNCARAASQ
jgi:hypothetical protein